MFSQANHDGAIVHLSLASEKQKGYDACDFLRTSQRDILLEIDKPTSALCDKRWLPQASSPLLYGGALFAITILPVAIAIILARAMVFPDATWLELLIRLWEKLGSMDWSRVMGNVLGSLAIVIFFIAQIIYIGRARRTERLVLTPEGIQYISPLPPALKRFNPDWFLAWQQIRTAELGTPNGRIINADFVLLTLTTATEKHNIYPARWVDTESHSRPPLRFKLSLGMQTAPQNIEKTVLSTDVTRYMSVHAPHIRLDSNLNKPAAFTSLEKNPHGQVAIGIIIALMLYAFIDAIVGPDSYIDEPMSFAYIYVMSGIGAAVISGFWLYKSTLAHAEKAGLAILIGAVFAGAMIPGALRINALTDTTGSATYDYQVTQNHDGVVLRPVIQSLPNIKNFARNEFWDNFDSHDTYPVQLHKGVLGFYQFNSAIIIEDIHSHIGN